MLPAMRAGQQGHARTVASVHSASSTQVIQEVSGLPYEGASEGNQYTPDVQRLNCQKVRLHPAQGGGPFLCLLSENPECQIQSLVLHSCIAAQLIRNTQCLLDKSRK